MALTLKLFHMFFVSEISLVPKVPEVLEFLLINGKGVRVLRIESQKTIFCTSNKDSVHSLRWGEKFSLCATLGSDTTVLMARGMWGGGKERRGI